MMKAFACVLIFVAIAYAASCPAATCQTNGNTCVSTADTLYTCQGGSFCSGSLTTATCQPVVALGGNCTGQTRAYGSTGVCGDNAVCTNGTTCTAIVQKYGPGYLCNSASDCVAGTCDSGRCSGLASGATCTSDSACGFGLFCDGTCKTTLAVGATCDPTKLFSGQCSDSRNPSFAFCSSTSKTCTAQFSVASGASCTSITDCKAGLICVGTPATCVSAQSGSSSNKACTTTSDCVNTEVCGCASAGAASLTCQKIMPFTQHYIDSYKAATTCEYSNFACFTNTGINADTSCNKDCYNKICSVVAQANKQVQTDQCSFTAAEKTAFNKCLKSSASALFIAPAVVLAAIFALFL